MLRITIVINFMAKNIERILGTSITEYTPNAIKFQGLSLQTLQHILQEGYTKPSAYFNATPSISSFIEFGQRCQKNGVTVSFDGIGYADKKAHDLVIDAITVIGVKDLDFAGEFVKFVWGCDELEINSQQLYAWWD
ncbi:hypothetical protein [Ancylothrix sp. D3o]|uniref:hypothetical protein n=1 Tax=Ancylothrix sp. D3o TaxID=2953691 RepID=UPI0021BB1D3F|nr:hypothetical protein [Ancylothrix sp. D3o]